MRYEDLLDAIVEKHDQDRVDARVKMDDARRKKARAAQKYQDQMRKANQQQQRAISSLSRPK
ncbi:hypothetical protein D3C72_669190 [compost metagenome]